MYGSKKNLWLKPLTGRRRRQPHTSRRLGVTPLAQRDCPSAFTQGNLVVLRVGDGTAALGTTATATFLDEYTPAGVLVQSIPLPTTASGANHALTEPGSTIGHGLMGNSADGRYLLVTGYDAATGTTGVTATDPAVNNRVVGRITSAGTGAGGIDTTTALNDNTSSIFAATSTDGQTIWTVGATAGGSARLTQF